MDCDVLVIGSGPGGYRAAVLAALRGRKTVVVEKGSWGGCCLNRGCVPKKAWHHSARLLDAAQRFAARGLTGTLRGDLGQAWRHQHDFVGQVRASYQSYLKRLGVTALSGEAAFTADGAVTVAGADLTINAQAVIIATGSAPHVPASFPVVPQRIIHSDLLFDEPVPVGPRVMVVGGGVIALEFSYIFQAFGRDVQWFSRRDPFARGDFSAAAMKLLRTELAQRGLVPNGAPVASLDLGEGCVRLVTQGGEVREADWVLLATGRRPVTAGLHLERAGVACDEQGFIVVDDEMRTTVPRIYALGDCVAGPMTANRALHEAGVAVTNIVHPHSARRDLARVPEAIYSALELARVGLTEEQAEDQGLEPGAGFAAFETSPRALGQDESAGFVRVVADTDTGDFLGGEVVGTEAGELIHLLTTGKHDTILARLAAAVFNHPSRAEEFQNAVDTLAAKWHLENLILGSPSSGGDAV